MIKAKNYGIKIFIIIFVAMLYVLPLFSFIDEDIIKSDLENRNLSQLPKVNKSALLSGRLFNGLETYYSDQIYGRNTMLNIYSKIQTRILVKKKVNKIVLGNEGQLLEYKNYIAKNTSIPGNYGNMISDALAKLKKVTNENNGELYYLNIPFKNDMYYDMYPKYYENGHDYYLRSEQIKLNNIREAGVNIVDVTNILQEAKEKNEYIYYKTDHHYTFKGAYYTYMELIKSIKEKNLEYNLNYPKWEDMNLIRVDKRFVGSYLRLTGNTSNNSGDYLEYALPNDYPKFDRYESGKKYSNKVINDYQYNQVDYSYFLGDRANTVIKTYRSHLPNILFIGDSYTNALEIMAVHDFNEMHSIDPRYYKGSISEYIKNTKPDVVVVVRDDLYDGNKGNISTIE